eukprot:TRINITY_DN994_c0_g1_i2.p1 TRINITY_DN994_c0_g1~~TRINITY_DN994_c0_g1_i2.p1  ORF type:complete len:356 (+),score=124.20 TRINITY_DN994_c0_g1_i2:1301-2368(+)
MSDKEGSNEVLDKSWDTIATLTQVDDKIPSKEDQVQALASGLNSAQSSSSSSSSSSFTSPRRVMFEKTKRVIQYPSETSLRKIYMNYDGTDPTIDEDSDEFESGGGDDDDDEVNWEDYDVGDDDVIVNEDADDDAGTDSQDEESQTDDIIIKDDVPASAPPKLETPVPNTTTPSTSTTDTTPTTTTPTTDDASSRRWFQQKPTFRYQSKFAAPAPTPAPTGDSSSEDEDEYEDQYEDDDEEDEEGEGEDDEKNEHKDTSSDAHTTLSKDIGAALKQVELMDEAHKQISKEHGSLDKQFDEMDSILSALGTDMAEKREQWRKSMQDELTQLATLKKGLVDLKDALASYTTDSNLVS